MNIAIIGGGFTGLSAAYELTKHGHSVTLFEAGKELGGLAYGFKAPTWDWSLEYAYHHWFTNDRAMLDLIKELGLEQKLIIKRPITANLLPGDQTSSQMAQMDSPLHLLKFPGLSLIDKLRTSILLAFLKINPFWKPLESITAKRLLLAIGGKNAYQILWEPLLVGKFDTYADHVSAAWFWARIKKRTPSLAYMEGGFRTVIDALAHRITSQKGTIHLQTSVESIQPVSGGSYEVLWKNQKQKFQKILLTIPTPLVPKILPVIPHTYTATPLTIPHLWAQTLILETREPILKDIYWLNVTDRSYPFLAAVAHTNFMDTSHYGGHHLTYFGNYLPQGHRYLSMTKEELLKEFLPFIKRLALNSKLSPLNSYLFVGPFAQPVHELHYSERAPKLETPLPNVFLANMDSIYPWDRGTNYAVELGKKAATYILREAK